MKHRAYIHLQPYIGRGRGLEPIRKDATLGDLSRLCAAVKDFVLDDNIAGAAAIPAIDTIHQRRRIGIALKIVGPRGMRKISDRASKGQVNK